MLGIKLILNKLWESDLVVFIFMYIQIQNSLLTFKYVRIIQIFQLFKRKTKRSNRLKNLL